MLETTRKWTRPGPDDTWQTIAARELGDMPPEEALGQLQSWNFHVFMRPAPPAGSPREGNPLLPSDVIFLAPPQARG